MSTKNFRNVYANPVGCNVTLPPDEVCAYVNETFKE